MNPMKTKLRKRTRTRQKNYKYMNDEKAKPLTKVWLFLFFLKNEGYKNEPSVRFEEG